MRVLLATVLLLTSTLVLQAQTTDADVKREFEQVEAFRPQQAIIVDIKARIPDHSIYQRKTDTAIKPVYLSFNQNILRETNKILLHKWLKESK